jgi:hypothetical protein
MRAFLIAAVLVVSLPILGCVNSEDEPARTGDLKSDGPTTRPKSERSGEVDTQKFSPDLDIAFRSGSFDIDVPDFGGFPGQGIGGGAQQGLQGLGGGGQQGQLRQQGFGGVGGEQTIGSGFLSGGEHHVRLAEFMINGFRGERKTSRESTQSGVTIWKRSQIVPNTSRLKVGDKDELPLKGVQANVRVDGFRARVVLDCFFYNDKAQPLEGSFQIRLPNEASLYFFAFGETVNRVTDQEIPRQAFFSVEQARKPGAAPKQILTQRKEYWDDPKVARMVPRVKAAFAYRQTVRRRVDPALVEWSGAGVFSARVFPLAPQKLHRIVIGYDVPLIAAGDDLVYRLDLPTVPSCVVDVSVAEIPNAHVTVTPKAQPARFGGRTHYRFEDPDERTISVRIDDPGTIMLAGSNKETGAYFTTTFRPELPAADAQSGPSRGVFLVDVSLSSNPERFNIWLKLLRTILKNNRDSMKQFAVLFFNIESFWWWDGFVANNDENADALFKFADTLSLEGATNLGRALAEAVGPSWPNPSNEAKPFNLFLLSDGEATWGENDLYSLSNTLNSASGPALFAYSTSMSGTSTRTLSHLARESGGAVFSVVGEAQVAQAAKAHRRQAWRIEGVRVTGGRDLLLAGRPTSIFPGQKLLLVGRGLLDDQQPEVVLILRRGNEQKQVHTKIDHLIKSDLAPRTYGQVAVSQLETLTDATEEISTAFARHFRVTGKTCSLLMLDSEEDYKRFNIKPEEDAFVVNENAASEVFDVALRQLGDLIGNPKAAFLAWLEKLEDLPGVEFHVPTALRLALKKIPTAAFAVKSPPLASQQWTWQGIPGDIQEQLASKELDYDAISREAVRRLKKHGPADALCILSSLVESHPGDSGLARDVGFTAMEWGLGGEAYSLFRRVAVSRPYEPQTYQAMARCLTGMEQADLAIAYYEVALAGKWDEIVGMEYLHLLRRVAAGEFQTNVPDFARARLNSLSSQFDSDRTDLVVTIMWNTGGTDVDLHVTDPNGEECLYSHRQTKIGGRLTEDVTEGYGPEMFRLKQAVPGRYRIRVNYFSSDVNRTGTRTKVFATIYQGWGTQSERVTRKVVTLRTGKEMHDIATIIVKR